MHKFSLLSFFVVVTLSIQQAVSLPFDKRAIKPAVHYNETVILSLALELENVEIAFYKEGLKQFNATAFAAANFSASVYQRYQEIKEHEITHAALLTAALGKDAPLPCNYSFPFNNLEGFVNLSLIFEGVGTAAYTGAMQFLSSPDTVTAAASILATEARQASYLGTEVVKVSPWGTAFEPAISASEAFTLASGFTTSCPPTNRPLGLQVFPALNITGNPVPEQNITVQSPGKPTHLAFISGPFPQFVPFNGNGPVTVPANISGQVYVVATNATELLANTTVAGPSIILVETNSTGALIN